MSRPNILLVIWHDLGDWLGCYREDVASPVLARFASQGAVFDNYFCTAPQCSPSRASIMTGRMPHSNGVMGLIHRGYDMNRDERPLAQLLQAAGYHTCLIGLQHEAADSRWEGYEELRIESKRADYVVPQAVDFLQGYDDEKPFFLSLGTINVHRAFRDAYDPEVAARLRVPPFLPDAEPVRRDLATFHRYIAETDTLMVPLFETLEALGLVEETLVIFTTDHGADLPRAKTTLYDSGLKTALMMRWPGRIPAGFRSDALLSNVDFLPTVMDLVGLDVPPNLHGHSFKGLISGRDRPARSEVFGEITWHGGTYWGKRCIRTHTHKFIRNFEPRRPFTSHREARERLGELFTQHIKRVPPPEELYDLREDPHELQNLAGNPDHEETQARLQERLMRWLAATRDPILAGPVPHANPEYTIEPS